MLRAIARFVMVMLLSLLSGGGFNINGMDAFGEDTSFLSFLHCSFTSEPVVPPRVDAAYVRVDLGYLVFIGNYLTISSNSPKIEGTWRCPAILKKGIIYSTVKSQNKKLIAML